MIGPGKYDELATQAREAAKARGVILILIEGDKGAGFAVQGDFELTLAIPSILRSIADQIEQDAGGTPQ